MHFIVIGCGLSGSVISRELAESGHIVEIWDRRNHIGGNMYDSIDEYGIIVHQYGPHTFHTKNSKLLDYISKYEEWQEYHLTCGATWMDRCSPTPFNYSTIDMYYSPDDAEKLKRKLISAYPEAVATVVELLNSKDEDIRKYAEFLFKMDYAPYTAKQWGVNPSQIDPSILKRVPIRFSYDEGYFDDPYQVLPIHSYVQFFKNILNHPNITVKLNVEALNHMSISDKITVDGHTDDYVVVYTGPLDQMFSYVYGKLPYRSLRFEWKHEDTDSFQKYPVVAYPQEPTFTRITEYSKLPVQTGKGTTYAIEYSLPTDEMAEPYYPVLTDESIATYSKYAKLADSINNLYYCGRLADFKYYNMDQALQRALELTSDILKDYP